MPFIFAKKNLTTTTTSVKVSDDQVTPPKVKSPLRLAAHKVLTALHPQRAAKAAKPIASSGDDVVSTKAAKQPKGTSCIKSFFRRDNKAKAKVSVCLYRTGRGDDAHASSIIFPSPLLVESHFILIIPQAYFFCSLLHV